MTDDDLIEDETVSLGDDGTLHIDRSPEGNRERASQSFSGEVFTEWGIIDIDTTFPSKPYSWKPEYPPDAVDREAREMLAAECGIDPTDDVAVAGNCSVDHVTVPVRVSHRGITTYGNARRSADSMNDDCGYTRYHVALLSDTRGL